MERGDCIKDVATGSWDHFEQLPLLNELWLNMMWFRRIYTTPGVLHSAGEGVKLFWQFPKSHHFHQRRPQPSTTLADNVEENTDYKSPSGNDDSLQF